MYHTNSRAAGRSSRFQENDIAASPQTDQDAGNGAKRYLVPLYLSTSGSTPHTNSRSSIPALSPRSRTSTRSLIDSNATAASNRRFFGEVGGENDNTINGGQTYPPASVVEQSDLYGGSNQDGSRVSSSQSVSRQSSRQSPPAKGPPRRVRTRSRSNALRRRQRIQNKARISVAFGGALLASLIVYIVFVVTGIARTTLFHVLSVLLILSLTGVFSHSLIRMIMLIRAPAKQSQRRQHYDPSQPRGPPDSYTGPREWTTTQARATDSFVPTMPIPIFMVEDEESAVHEDDNHEQSNVIQHPPPVYGNVRNSVKLNPDLIHVHQIPPTPLTPTYDQAMKDVQQSVGYRPPSYLSETGITEVLESRRRDVNAALANIRPQDADKVKKSSKYRYR